MSLSRIVEALSTAGTSETDAALAALADPSHPAQAAARDAILNPDPTAFFCEPFTGHPYCIRILRRELDDKTPIGTTASVDSEGNYVERSGSGYSSAALPELIADPATRRQRAELRHCDIAAVRLESLIIGLPKFHPLMINADQRLDQIRTILDQKMESVRLASNEEKVQGGGDWMFSRFVYVFE